MRAILVLLAAALLAAPALSNPKSDAEAAAAAWAASNARPAAPAGTSVRLLVFTADECVPCEHLKQQLGRIQLPGVEVVRHHLTILHTRSGDLHVGSEPFASHGIQMWPTIVVEVDGAEAGRHTGKDVDIRKFVEEKVASRRKPQQDPAPMPQGPSVAGAVRTSDGRWLVPDPGKFTPDGRQYYKDAPASFVPPAQASAPALGPCQADGCPGVSGCAAGGDCSSCSNCNSGFGSRIRGLFRH